MESTIYLNDNNTRTSKPVRFEDVSEIAGITYKEWTEKYHASIDELNADLYEFTFSVEPEFTPYAIWKEFSFKDRGCVVYSAHSAEQAWEAAEAFLADQSDDEVTYCTGLDSGDSLTMNEDGSWSAPVKVYEHDSEE